MASKQVQLITMHSYDFSDKGRPFKQLVVCWMLLNLLSLSVKARILFQVNDHIDSLDDHFEIKGKVNEILFTVDND